MKPSRVLLFLVSTMGILGLISFVFPKDGMTVFGKTYNFIPLEDLFSNDESEPIDVEQLLQARQDSLKVAMNKLKLTEKDDSLAKIQNTSDPMRLQYSKEIPNGLDKFFEALYKRQNGTGNVRIIHYGDSQIEEDRITGYVRSRLQAKFGGGGVGLASASSITSSYGIGQVFSENWSRLTAFGNGEKPADGRYGSMAIMCKYQNSVTDSTTDTVVVQRNYSSATVTFMKRGGSALTNSSYNKVRIFMGFNVQPVTVKIAYNGLTEEKIVPANTALQIINFQLSAIPKTALKITFDGYNSPEVYGISLEKNGVLVDNVPMRGCSGTIFYKLNYQLSQQMYQALQPNLFIFQYGGNVMPYIKTDESAINFGKQFKGNVERIKKMCPNAAILVIGPSDMSKKINGKMQTYPILPKVRDELKKVTQELGGAYFDMYEVMGGQNSMPSWVASNPPLAAKDYIHFSPKGAAKIAEIFYEALMLDYEEYLIRKGKTSNK